MRFRNIFILVFTLACSLTISGCVTPPLGAAALTREVPRLKVSMDCGDCQVRPNAPDLIVRGYTEAATKSGAKIDNAQEAAVSVKEYIARNDTARLLAGAFAGKDEIKAEVIFRDKSFAVEDYYRNAWLGISELSQKIGEMIFEKIKQ